MSPERLRDPAFADPLIDVYGLGAVAYFLLTGKRLFDAPNEYDLQRMVLEVDAPRASSTAPRPVPPPLDDLVARCLEKDRAARPQSVDEVIDVFNAFLREQPWSQDEAAGWWQEYRAVQEAAAV